MSNAAIIAIAEEQTKAAELASPDPLGGKCIKKPILFLKGSICHSTTPNLDGIFQVANLFSYFQKTTEVERQCTNGDYAIDNDIKTNWFTDIYCF
jgi:hypothetical protein